MHPGLMCQRERFDIPPDIVYLDCASQGPILRRTVEAGDMGVRRKAQPWLPYRPRVHEEIEELRALYAALVGAAGDDISIVNSASYGIATAAANLPIEKGQSIVVLENQYSSNFHIWNRRCEATGAEMVTVPRPADGDWTPGVLAALEQRTAIAALPPCHWTDGSRVDLVAVGAACRETGSALVVDATQAIGAMPIDVAAIQPDFMVASGYKWLLCPYTLAFLYAAPHRQGGRPLEEHEHSRGEKNLRTIPPGYSFEFWPGARRYDMGERDNPVGIPMAITALEALVDWTPEAIADYLGKLVDAVAEAADARGLDVPAHRVGHYIGIRGFDRPVGELVTGLGERGIHVSARGGALRVSPYLYNDEADVQRLLAALDELLG